MMDPLDREAGNTEPNTGYTWQDWHEEFTVTDETVAERIARLDRERKLSRETMYHEEPCYEGGD